MSEPDKTIKNPDWVVPDVGEFIGTHVNFATGKVEYQFMTPDGPQWQSSPVYVPKVP